MVELGEEQSGHIIFLDHNTTGDGVPALQLLSVLVRPAAPFATGRASEEIPQLLQNVRVARKKAEENTAIREAIAKQRTLGPKRTDLVRASGTEPLIG